MMFESKLYQRQTTEMERSIALLLAELALNTPEGAAPPALEVKYRPDVSTRLWWELRFTGRDGEPRVMWAVSLELLLWRVATCEARIDEKMKLAAAIEAQLRAQEAQKSEGDCRG